MDDRQYSHPDLKFDLRAMVDPKTPVDLITCCEEALAELAVINKVLDQLLADHV